MTSEARARVEMDRLLEAAGWQVCDYKAASIHAATSVAIRESPLFEDHGHAEYLRCMERKAANLADIEPSARRRFLLRYPQ